MERLIDGIDPRSTAIDENIRHVLIEYIVRERGHGSLHIHFLNTSHSKQVDPGDEKQLKRHPEP